MDLAMSCIGLMALLVVVLGLRISLMRGSTNTIIGSSTDPCDPLFKWVRAHGNACEYVPILAIMIFALASRGSSWWHSWLFIGAVAFRYSHAVGMITCDTLDKPHPLRFAGALGTYVVGILLALAMVAQ
jgi:uncharacterized protein